MFIVNTSRKHKLALNLKFSGAKKCDLRTSFYYFLHFIILPATFITILLLADWQSFRKFDVRFIDMKHTWKKIDILATCCRRQGSTTKYCQNQTKLKENYVPTMQVSIFGHRRHFFFFFPDNINVWEIMNMHMRPKILFSSKYLILLVSGMFTKTENNMEG